MVNRSQGRLDSLREMVDKLGTDIAFEYICNQDPARNDAIMAALPPGSIVINATGMGKDRPGSPITDAGLFPRGGIAWEFNYRGELDFLHQALAQQAAPGAARRGRLGLLPARLDAGDRPGLSYCAGRCAFRPAGGHRREHTLTQLGCFTTKPQSHQGHKEY